MMRKSMRLLICATSLAASALMAGEQANLLKNAGFERFAVGGEPDAWRRVGGSAANSERSAANVRLGQYALKLSDPSSSTSIGVESDVIPVAEGATYRLSGYIYREQSSATASIYLRYYDENMTQIYNVSLGSGSAVGSWNYVSAERRAPVGARFAKVLCYSTINSVGTMYFDALSLRREDTRLVDNPDMAQDADGSYPSGWKKWVSNSQPVTVAVDPLDPDNLVMKLEDSSTTTTASTYTSFTVTPNMTYTASVDMLRYSGSVPALYLKYYNEAGAEIFTTSVSPTVSGVWQRRSITAKAPEGAASARILAYIAIPSTGVAYFDNFEFKPVYETLYVAPAALGSGNGSSAANAAKYNNATFWSGVNTKLASNSVKVVFLEGEYIINENTDRLNLQNIGTNDHVLVMEGQRPFGTVFTRNASATAHLINMVVLRYAKNIVVRHLHWEDDAPTSAVQTGYSIAVQSASTGNPTKNITVEGCTFVGLWRNYYGALGFHHAQTSNVMLRRSEFVGGGFDSHFHMVYNSYGPTRLRTLDNYFQDAMGSYVRHRADCTDVVVLDNEFVSTASAYNRSFLEQAVFNDVNPGDETLGHTFLYSGNTFVYQVAGGSQTNIAVRVHASGFDPYVGGVLWNYTLTAAEGAIMASGSTAAKKALLISNFNLDFDTNIIIENNVRIGYHEIKAIFSTYSNYGAPNKGGNGHYDISSLVGD